MSQERTVTAHSKGLQLESLQDMMSLGQIFHKSGMFTDIKDQAQAVVKIIAGRELGLGPIQSMTGIYMVKGNIALTAKVMAALIKASGDYNYHIVTLDNEKAVLEFYERGKKVYTSVFTIKDASLAGVSGSDNWRKWPRNMLFARALSNGARFVCPHILAGAYVREELGEEGDAEDLIVNEVVGEGEFSPISDLDEILISKRQTSCLVQTLGELTNMPLDKAEKLLESMAQQLFGKNLSELTIREARQLSQEIHRESEEELEKEPTPEGEPKTAHSQPFLVNDENRQRATGAMIALGISKNVQEAALDFWAGNEMDYDTIKDYLVLMKTNKRRFENRLPWFWAQVKERGLTEDEVHKALDVPTIYLYDGDLETALGQIDMWVGDQSSD